MKRLLACALLALSSIAFGATTVPVQLLSPAGSTAGQAILSTGPSTAPVWGLTPLTGVTGTLALTNGGTGATTAANARTNLGAAATSGTLAQFAATTSAQLLGVISDETGSGALVFGTSPTITTPTITGVTNASSAAAGSVGQLSTNTTSGTSLANGTPANCTSVSLSAGDWDVSGSVQYIPSSATITLAAAGISTTSATLGAVGSITFLQGVSSPGAMHVASPVFQVNVSSTTTVFLVGQANFASGTVTCNGFVRARRMH